MRLLLDEQISPSIARELRRHGHDVVAVGERPGLVGRRDIDILVAAADEGRVVVTANVRDFARLGQRRLPDRRWHAGIVLVPRRAFPSSRDGFGAAIRAIDELLAAHPGDEDLAGGVVWLRPSTLRP